MKKHEIPSIISMMVVTLLLIMGFTIAWYSAYGRIPIVNGLGMQAADDGRIKVAVTADGDDISTLEGEAQYATLKFTSQVNIGQNQFAPGAYGSVTLYVTPLSDMVTGCTITPSMVLQKEESSTKVDVSDDNANNTVSITGSNVASTKLTDIANRHIRFFLDQAMTEPLGDTIEISKTSNGGAEWNVDGSIKDIEKPITLYWRWYYEYDASSDADYTNDFLLDVADQKAALTSQTKEDVYDLEDTAMGNNLDNIYFQFQLIPVVTE